MKTIFDSKTSDELIQRINNLQAGHTAVWGKMNLYQMLKHCNMSEEMFQGKTNYKRLLIGRLFGSMALKGILKNDSAMKQNQPTHPDMKISGAGNWQRERDQWIQLIKAYSNFSNSDFVHPFFGKMTKDAIGTYVYKHTDHHLKQFGA
jgi:hypothetical protein